MTSTHSSPAKPEVQTESIAVRPATRLDRIVTIVALGIAFVIMASVFSPEWSRAGDNQPPPSMAASPLASDSAANRHQWADQSTNPHEGLAMIGELYDSGYIVRMYAAPGGALYSIYDAQGQELSVLLTPAQVDARFPELDIQNVRFETHDEADRSARSGVQLLHAESTDDSLR